MKEGTRNERRKLEEGGKEEEEVVEGKEETEVVRKKDEGKEETDKRLGGQGRKERRRRVEANFTSFLSHPLVGSCIASLDGLR